MTGSEPGVAIPLVDVHAQYHELKPEIDAAIQRVLENGQFILGPEVASFERAFATFIGSREAVGVASGTAAIHLALLACGVGPGDEVITTAHTFIATAEAISLTGARPVFVDIDPATFNVNPEQVEDAITPRTRAILPVHLYGHPADMAALVDIASPRGIWLIEDAAQAHGAAAHGRACGTIGHLAGFSFYPGKNLGAFGDAGAVTGGPPELTDRVRKLRDHGRRSKYEHDEVGFGERLDGLQAAILAVKLERLAVWNEARRRIATRYSDLLAGLPLTLPVEQSWARHVYHLYVVRSERRDELMRALEGAGIRVGIHYPMPLHRQPAYRSLEIGPLPETERAAAEVLSLPIYPQLRDDQVAYIAEKVVQFHR